VEFKKYTGFHTILFSLVARKNFFGSIWRIKAAQNLYIGCPSRCKIKSLKARKLFHHHNYNALKKFPKHFVDNVAYRLWQFFLVCGKRGVLRQSTLVCDKLSLVTAQLIFSLVMRCSEMKNKNQKINQLMNNQISCFDFTLFNIKVLLIR
jgi:hypothetical protein